MKTNAAAIVSLLIVLNGKMMAALVSNTAQLRVRGGSPSFESNCNKPMVQHHNQYNINISKLSRRKSALYVEKSSKDVLVLGNNEVEERDSIDLGSASITDSTADRVYLEMEYSNITISDIESTSDAAKSSTSPQLFGIPIQSVLLLNLVAVIWGTQHSVIKSVVDDSTTIELFGAGFIKSSLQSLGVNFNTVQNTAVGDVDNTAAYFTLARFGLAALLASPYTPGIREKNRTELDQLQQQSTTDDSKESIKLAWRYGAELGIYMFLGYAFQAIGLETTTASRSGFLLYLNVKFVPFFSFFLFGKLIKPTTWISALVAFGGTALLAFDNANVVADGTIDGLGAFTVGDAWSIAAAAVSAMFILRMEAASKEVPNSAELNSTTLWTVAMLSLLWTLGISYQSIDVVNTAAVINAIQQTFQQSFSTIISHPLPLIYLSGVTTALANLLQSKAQKDISAERASIIYALDPVYGAIFANILLGETLGELGIIGAFLIVVAAATNAFIDFGGATSGQHIKEKR